MIEKDKDIRSVITGVSFDIINEIAPEESDFFYDISDAYYTDPGLLKSDKSREDPVGFGIEGVIEMMSPAAIGVVTTVITYIATELFGVAKGVVTDELKIKIKSLFNKNKDKDKAKSDSSENKDSPILTQEQLKKIHEKAFNEGLALNMSKEKATELANALIASIVIY
ncbi:MAG TPA: hypothetical protein PKA90_05220 [Ignavibacteria bacterium]|nr:hypothetical protein [Ignavibacteria bacterium]HMR39811.1 hypothetical protein [Ignavibacteria bacterium]